MQTAVFWIEYVVATRGAPHLKSEARNYSIFVYYNLDVWIFFLIILLFLTFILWTIASILIKLFKSSALWRKFNNL